MNIKPTSIHTLIENMTPEIYRNMLAAVELGRWQNGEALTKSQREHCLQAIIAYDEKHHAPEQRVAWIDRTGSCGKAGGR